MKKKTLLFILILFFTLIASNIYAQVFPSQNINVIIDKFNLVIFPDQRPYIDGNNRTLVPVRFISEELGATVLWNPDLRQVTIIYEGNTIKLPLNSNSAIINDGFSDRQFDMGTKAVLTNNRVMVPLRFVTEAMGALVIWDDPSKTIYVERFVQRKPNSDLIETVKVADGNIYQRITSREGFKSIKNWGDFEGARTSTGDFTDYILSISERNLSDTFYFEFDTTNNSNISWISIYFSTDDQQNNFFYYDLTPDVIQNNKFVIVNKKQFKVGGGSPTWSEVKNFRIAFQSKSGTSFSIDPRRLATYNGPPPMITLWFDDGWEDNYKNAFEITTRIDPTIRGAIGLVGSLVGTDRYLKKDQISRLKMGGWEFVNHSYTHPDLTKLTNEEIKFEIEKNYSFISNYDPVGAHHFVVPFSAVNDRVIDVIKGSAISARYNWGIIDSIPFDPYNLGYIEVTNLTSFGTVREAIDKAIENNQWVGLLFHRIEDPATDRYSYGTQEFEQLIYYLSFRKNDIRVVTPSEAFRLSGIPLGLRP